MTISVGKYECSPSCFGRLAEQGQSSRICPASAPVTRVEPVWWVCWPLNILAGQLVESTMVKLVAAYLLAGLGGNASPSAADIEKILNSGEAPYVDSVA